MDRPAIDTVEIVDEPLTAIVGGDRTGSGLTKEQRRKRQLVQLLDEDFARFEGEVSRLLYYSEHYDPEELPSAFAEELGISNPYCCENCAHFEERSDGDYCSRYIIEEDDGSTRDVELFYTDEIPEFYEWGVREIEVPSSILDELPTPSLRLPGMGMKSTVGLVSIRTRGASAKR